MYEIFPEQPPCWPVVDGSKHGFLGNATRYLVYNGLTGGKLVLWLSATRKD